MSEVPGQSGHALPDVPQQLRARSGRRRRLGHVSHFFPRVGYTDPMLPTVLLILAIGAVGAACVLAKRVGPIVPFAFIAPYVLAVGATTFINIGAFDMVDPKFRGAWGME
jgi:hypothetical protein